VRKREILPTYQRFSNAKSALALLVARIAADHADNAATFDDLAVATHLFY